MKIPFLIISVIVFVVALPSVYGHEVANEGTSGLGNVHFETSCDPNAQPLFDRGVAAMHSFYFGEAKKSFNEALEKDRKCGIGYWGLAMTTLGNWLVSPPTSKAIADAQALLQKGFDVGTGTQRERDYLSALQALFTDADTREHRSRALAYERAMEALYMRYPQDQEAALFYALALNLTALPTDKTYANQLKAADILDKVSVQQPDHPGVLHYLIHSLDYPALAKRALPAAERYAQVAPAAPHALHMPSHTYSMLGEWEGSVRSNKEALAAAVDTMAKGLNSQPGLNGAIAHYNDFMIYADLQIGHNKEARQIVDEVLAYQRTHELSKDAIYTQTGFAAIPARYVLERKAWTEAARLETLQKTWAYAEAITRFTRSLGASHTGDPGTAQAEIDELAILRQTAIVAKQDYWEAQIEVLRLAASAWVAQAQGRTRDAVELMRQSADLEDSSEKHVAMENRLYPMRELLADLLLETGEFDRALTEYKASLVSTPNRFNGFYGAARAADLAGDKDNAKTYYRKLLALVKNADDERQEIAIARLVLTEK